VDEKSENEHALYSPIEESERRLGLDENVSGGKEGEGRSDSSNILDDMEKFQREIDELRTRYKQAGFSISTKFLLCRFKTAAVSLCE
jgi:hypothetical protein